MCGINGIVELDGQPVQAEALHSMNRAMIHRGPDDQGVWIDRQAGLGMRRLSIIDIEGARQPITSEDGTICIVGNGEIYNFKELREQLLASGHHFRTNGDIEVILHLYEQYGSDCVHYLRGMFAFAIWDGRTECLFAARDRFGIKPLYYMEEQGRFICSSEVKSLLAVCRQKPRIDLQSMVYYLTLQYVPESQMMFHGMHKLPPAHYLWVKDKSIQVSKYWQPEFTAADDHTSITKEQMKQQIVAALRDSVRCHMTSDVPVGCFLSSGIDSTAIASLMQQSLQRSTSRRKSASHGSDPSINGAFSMSNDWRSDAKLHTFSVGFAEDRNECLFSRQTAALLNSTHHEWIISEQEYFDMVQSSVFFQEDPVADPSAVALYGVSRMASEHVKVVLSGEGADELFGGYGIYREPHALQAISWLPASLKSAIRSFIRPLPNFYGKNYLLRATLSLEDRYVGNAKVFSDDLSEVLVHRLKKDLAQMKNAFQLTKPYYDQLPEVDEMTRMQWLDMHFWLPGNILAKADKMSMAHSLEVRVPYLDSQVFAAAAIIPPQYRVHKQMTKYLFREALRDVVPPHVLHRPKLGFPVPLRLWLQGKRGLHCLETIRASGISEFLNMRYLEQLVSLHRSGRADVARKIWCLYILALWHERFVS